MKNTLTISTRLPENYKTIESSNHTEKNLLNERLKASELRYRRLFESAKDGILILNFETGHIVEANPFIVKMIDSPLEEIIGKKLWEIGLFSNKEQSEITFTELKANGYIRFEDMPIQRKNGKITEVEFVSNVYLENNIKVIQCNIRDITERKLADEALFQNEQLLSKTQKIAHIGSYNYNITTGEIKWSDEMYNILGLEKDIFRVTIKSFMNSVHPDDRSAVENWMELTKHGIDADDLDFRIVKPDGTIRDLFGTGILQHEHNSSTLHIIGSAQDITSRKNIEKELAESEQYLNEQNLKFISLNKEYVALNEKLIDSLNRLQHINADLLAEKIRADESDRLKTAFLSNISHEIRTPMNAILGFSAFLLQPGLSSEKLKDFVQIINASGLQLMSVISDILDISKIEAGQINIDIEEVTVNNLLGELFSTYKKIVEPKNLRLHYSCDSPSDLIRVKTDGNRVKQVLCNLLNNAIKFTKVGKIEFGFKVKQNFLEFYVSDTGIGIAPENQEVIFQRFRQVAKSDNQIYGGNGLGLSISKALVEKLGGTLTVNSTLGSGSTFKFTIPYLREEDNVDVTSIPSTSVENKHWKDKTILIVEDEVNSHLYMEEVLSDSNVILRHAWDGKDAVEQVKEHPEISLVLMDIKMPVMDGYKATQLIKQIRPELPVIAQTAFALSYDKAGSLQAGFDNYISKPVSVDALLEIVGNYLN